MRKNNYSKKAITIVELIVVITILAILGVIAFIGFQSYTVYSRDAVRVADINSIKSVLEYNFTEGGYYPIPDGGVAITYSGATVWTQGTFSSGNRRATKRLDKVPVDPLTQNEYTYSVLNTNSRFELGAILEGDEIVHTIGKNSYAENSDFIAYIDGNFRGQLASVSTGGLDYVLAVPSIINSNIDDTLLVDILNKKGLVINGQKNIPHSYKIEYTPTSDDDMKFVNTGSLVIYSGSIDDLKDNESDRITLISNLQKAYSGTIVAENSQNTNISKADIDTSSPDDITKNTAISTVNSYFIFDETKKIPLITGVTSGGGDGEATGCFLGGADAATLGGSNPCILN